MKTLQVAALLASIVLMFGCAEREMVKHERQQQNYFWRDCQETVSAKADGYRHFICTDYNGKEYEVNIKRKD